MKITVDDRPTIMADHAIGEMVLFRSQVAAALNKKDAPPPPIFVVCGVEIVIHERGVGVQYHLRNASQQYGTSSYKSDVKGADIELMKFVPAPPENK